VSQANAANRGFTLSAVPAGTDEQGSPLVAFEFALPNPDAAAPAGQQEAVARSEGLAVIGEWVHLAAVYEAGNQLLTLYVNYDEVSSAAVPFVPVNEVGGVRLGRAQVNAAAPAFWLGEVDDVYVFAGALDSAQVLERFLDARPRP
jgi:hypothetical protein